MRRREFIGLLGGAATAASGAWPAPARAQGKIPRIGYFWNDFPDPNVGLAGLRQGLQERGYVLGRNLLLEERYAEGDPSRTRDLITELLALGVDVLVTGDFALIQAHTLTATVPIVGVAGDFVGVGLAAKLSRPGGNVTGLSLLSAELSPKWLELLQAAVPNLNRVAFLGGFSGLTAEEKRGLDQAAPRFHVTLTQLDMYRANFEASLEAITSESFDGLIVSGESDAESLIPRIVAHAAQSRMPTIYGTSTAVRQGGLMSYSADSFELWRHAAGYIDRILKGAKPGDLPIEQATAIKFAVNLKTARALGIEIPPDVARQRRRGDRMRRRTFLVIAWRRGVAWPLGRVLQERVRRVSAFWTGAAPNPSRRATARRTPRSRLGRGQERSQIEHRSAGNDAERLPLLAAELVATRMSTPS